MSERTENSIIAVDLKLSRPGGFQLGPLSFELKHTEHLVITGPSGSGKTSLALAMAGKLFFTGKLTINFVGGREGEIDGSADSSVKKVQLVDQRYQIKNRSNTVDGYYQQRFNSTENEDAYTVQEELLAIKKDTVKIDALLKEFSIEYLRDKTLLKLSSGEHKRFQLVKLLLAPGPLVILDEPFVGLDVDSRQKLNKLLPVIAKQGTQFIIIAGAVSHFPTQLPVQVLELQNAKMTYFGAGRDYEAGFQSAVKSYDIEALPLQPVAQEFKTAVRMVNTTVRYGDKTILSEINWTVEKGERWLLKGHNGAGKSTLLSLVYGDNPQAYANEIYLFDKRRGSGESIWDIKKYMGFVSPELHAFFDKNISCFDAVASGFFDTMGLYRKLAEDKQILVQRWMDVLGLTAVAGKRLSDLSTGQQRLVMLIRAFIKNPAIIVLDEPCQGLDEWQTAAFVELVEGICTRTGATLLYISHYANEIPDSIEKVLELNQGIGRVYERQDKRSHGRDALIGMPFETTQQQFSNYP